MADSWRKGHIAAESIQGPQRGDFTTDTTGDPR